MLTKFAGNIPGVKVLLGKKSVEFPGSGLVEVRTGSDPGRLRGPGLNGVVLDECAYQKAEVWGEVLQPALADRKGWAFFISSPNGRDNWFFDLFEAAENLEGWQRWQKPTSDNPRIDPEEIERARRLLPPETFSKEFLAAFTVAGGQVFKSHWIRYYEETSDYYLLGERRVQKDDCWRFSTADLAASTKETADYTAIGTWDVSPESDLILDEDLVWCRLEAPDIVPEMQRIYDRLKPGFMGVEKNGLGLPIVQYAIRAGLPIRGIDAGRQDIVSRSMPAAARMEAGRIWLPRNARWLKDFETELLSFPSGRHDDIIAMLSYAAIEIAGTRLFDVGNLVESEKFDFGLAEKDLGLVTNTSHDDLVETEDYEAWVEEEWR